MTTKKTTEKDVAVKSAKATSKPAESVYSVDELAQNHHVFNTDFAIVETALKLAGKESATLKEARKIVDEFKNREV